MALFKTADEKAAKEREKAQKVYDSDLYGVMNASGDARKDYFNTIMRDSVSVPDWYAEAWRMYALGAINYTSFMAILREHILKSSEMGAL